MSKRRSVDSSSCSYSSGNDSAFGENDLSCTSSPNPESVRATVNMYVSAAKVGREAFARGDLRAAVQQFDQALALELQTELDCIYDPSIGMVSGLVRAEVSERMNASPQHSSGCNRIMQSLQQIYKDTEATVRVKPTDPVLYLRMGAALCCANEWEKAKKIYTDGLGVCKDRRGLKCALRRLCRMEEITTGKDIPSEPYEPSSEADKRLKSRTLPFLTSVLRARRKSASVNFEAMDLTSTTSTVNNRQRISKSPALIDEKKAKPRAKRVSSFGRIRTKKVPEVDHNERESWSKVFQSDICSEQVHLKPSAITQMRKLSIEFLDDNERMGSGLTTKAKPAFAVINFQSMKIDSDDSELEDD